MDSWASTPDVAKIVARASELNDARLRARIDYLAAVATREGLLAAIVALETTMKHEIDSATLARGQHERESA